MRRLIIAHVTHGFAVGGLERGIARLVNHLDLESYRHHVFCFSSIGEARRWIEPGRAELAVLSKRPGNDLGLVRRLGALFQRERVDVAHSHNWGTLVETAWACRRAGIAAHVHGLHGAPAEAASGGWVRARARAWATRAALERAGAVTAVSAPVRDRYVAWCGVSGERIEVIPNGVDSVDPGKVAEARRASRARLGLSPQTTLIGSVGRLEPVKGFGDAVEAVAELARGGWDLHLMLVGHGSLESELRRRAERLGLDGRLTLRTAETEAMPWLAAMDVFVNSSLSEGLSQALLEAMAVGLPLVVTDVGDNAAVVGPPAACGLVAPPGDARTLARLLLELRDPALRRDLGRRSREAHRLNFRTERMVERFDRLYRRVVSPP